MAADPERRIPLEGCFNFRDLGGYVGAGGRRVGWRTLFRADGLSRLTPADLGTLRDIGLRTVIDLRTAQELTDRGRVDPDGATLTYHHLPMIDVLPPAEEMGEWIDPVYVAGQYLSMLGSGARSVALALEVLADATVYPAAFHCMAGKDRTGILSALVLGLLGVADDDIVSDYALSGEAMERMLAWLRTTHPERATELGTTAAAAAVVAAEPTSMSLFLRDLRATYGSIDGYVDGLGLAGTGERLRAQLLQPAP